MKLKACVPRGVVVGGRAQQQNDARDLAELGMVCGARHNALHVSGDPCRRPPRKHKTRHRRAFSRHGRVLSEQRGLTTAASSPELGWRSVLGGVCAFALTSARALQPPPLSAEDQQVVRPRCCAVV